MKEFLIAVDPGSSGGIAWHEWNGETRAAKMPETDEAKLKLARDLVNLARIPGESSQDAVVPVRVLIELVGGYVKPPKRSKGDDEDEEDKGGQPGSAMFKFGEGYGLMRGLFLALGAKVELIPPKRWQEPLFVKKGRMEKDEWKRVLRGVAQKRFPNVKATLYNADALLILSFGGLKEAGSASMTPAKPQTRQGEALSTGPAPKSGALKLYEGDWKGTQFVFKPLGNGFAIVRRATDNDVLDLKPLPKNI